MSGARELIDITLSDVELEVVAEAVDNLIEQFEDDGDACYNDALRSLRSASLAIEAARRMRARSVP